MRVFPEVFDRRHLDMSAYDWKFFECQRYLDGDDSLLPRLLKDVTCFSYLMFRLDGEPLKLYPYQDVILNDPHKFIYFRSSNQTGKSISLDVIAARNLLIDHGKANNSAIVSKSLPQATFQMRRVKMLLNTMRGVDWEESKGDTDNTTIVTVNIYDDLGKVKYQNMLVCAPCTEGLLGYDLHTLLLDEFEFWEVDQEYFFNQIAEPRTYHTKGRIMIFTNPNGADTFGARLEKLRLPDGSLKFHTYCFNFLDKPGNTNDELEVAKAGKTRQQIESTLLAIRSLSDRNYFTANEIDSSLDKSLKETSMVGKQPFFFLDVGSTHDQCCLIGGYVETDEFYDSNKSHDYNRPHVHLYIPIIHLYPSGYPLTRVVGVPDDGMDSDGWHSEKSVKEYLDEWSVDGVMPVFGYDATGNSGMKPLFESIGIHGTDITFTGPSKSGYYQRFKYMMEKRLIHRIKHEAWERQASDLIATKSVRGYLLINSGQSNNVKAKTRAQKIADDSMDATAGLIQLTDNTSVVTPGVTLLGGTYYEDEQSEEDTESVE